ncbi:MAG: putative DNA binding domain-containing protein [Clostridia bacterium]|nr:putative DNA binding domain-containing protein [Clostridia bacterium]
MAIPTNIHTLLSGNVVEWARIELKKSWNPAASLKTITAFANDIDNWGGGYLVIGVDDDNGRPKYPIRGLKLSEVDDIQKDLLNKCKLIEPDYLPIVAPMDYDDHTKLIVVWCPGGAVRPYRSPASFTYEKNKAVPSSDSIYWIRKMASTIRPSSQEINDLFALSNQIPFDDRICHHADMTDLNLTLIKAYLKEIDSALFTEADTMDFNRLCISMGISNSMPEFMKPKNVGLLFFSMEPEKFIPCAQIDVVEFPEGVGGDEIEEKSFKGPLHQQLREALKYIQNTVIKERVVKHSDRAEADRFFNYPYAAIEESLANAVYHKAYDVREPIEVRVEKDKIEILSFPGPDRSVTVEALKNYSVFVRRYRNRRIGDFLKELRLTEGRNTGFRKILNALEKNGSPLPEFITDDDHSFFITRLFIRDGFGDQNQSFNSKVLKHHDEALDEALEERLLDVIRKKPQISQLELASCLSVSRATIQRMIKILSQSGAIVRKDGKRYGYWEVQK